MTSGEIRQAFEPALPRRFCFKIKRRSFLYGKGYGAGALHAPSLGSFGQRIAEGRAGAHAHAPETAAPAAAHRRIHRDPAGQMAVLSRAEAIVVLLPATEHKLLTGNRFFC